MKPNSLIAGASIFAVMAALGGPASASHTWNNYHWARTSHPMPLQVIDGVTSDWQFELTTSVAEWNVSEVLDMTITSADDSSRTRRQCRLVSGQMHVCNQAYGYNGWLGLATIGLDSQGHIDRGSAQMNDTYSSYWADPNEKRHVMCQEIGHVFGLDHTSEDGSSQGTCMDYSMSPSSISPNQHDYDQLTAQYSHFDNYISYDDGGGSGGGCSAPPGKGCNKNGQSLDAPAGIPAGAIRVHASKFEEIWVKGRPDGGHWVFYVRLAPTGAR